MKKRTHIFIITALALLTLVFMNTTVIMGLGGDHTIKLVFKPFHGLQGVYASETVRARCRGFRRGPPWSLDPSRYTLLRKTTAHYHFPLWYFLYDIGFTLYFFGGGIYLTTVGMKQLDRFGDYLDKKYFGEQDRR